MKPFYISLKPFINHGAMPRPTDWLAVFGNHHPIEVEIGFGNGEYLAQMTQDNPGINYIGFEEYCQRIVRTLRKLSRVDHGAVRVMRLDARAGFMRYIAPKTLAKVHCLYPPPWPRKSDIKHRLFTTEFLRLVNSRLKEGGVFKIVTDHRPLIEWIQEQLPGSGFHVDFKNIPASYGTKFEKKWVEGGQAEFYELLLTKEKHQDIPVTEDTPVQSYLSEHFNPERFTLDEYSKDGIAVAFKDFLYDPMRKTGVVHVIAADGPLMQNVRVVIAHSPKGWRVNLAEGTMLMPTLAVAEAVTKVYEAVCKSAN